MKLKHYSTAALCAAAALLVAGCGSDGGSSSDVQATNPYAAKPLFLSGEPTRIDYDGVSNGLLTGKATSLANLLTYAAANSTPTAPELRTLAIQTSYYKLVDISAGSGFGTYYGTMDVRANKGAEYIGISDDGSGTENVMMVVQVPSHFDLAKPCIVTATSSGSRGAYGEVSTVGEWGLNKGCAVAYTDKGTGTGAMDLDNDRGFAFDGSLVAAGTRKDLTFNTNLLGDNLAAYRTANPNRYALKHLHSKRNSEKDWGKYTQQAIKTALYAINKQFPDHTFTPQNTIVIASSISNGAGAAILAAEQDTEGLIGGVAVAEPQINLPDNANVTVKRGANTLSNVARPLFDYTTYANLYQPCATQAPSLVAMTAFIDKVSAQNRCAGLAALGLVSGSTVDAQAADALSKLRAYGWEAESDTLHDSHFAFEFTNLVATAYASAYSRAPVSETICGYSVGGFDGAKAPALAAATPLRLFGVQGSGLAYDSVRVINDLAKGGADTDSTSVSARSGVKDFNVDGAACLRRLMTQAAVGNTALTATEKAVAARIATGMGEIRVNGNLRGKPTIIVHGRSDALIPVNHTSRPYAALNKRQDAASNLHYYEVTDANHFDALVTYYPRTLVPLHVYGARALDLMYDFLSKGSALPPSQVVRAVARSSPAAVLSDVNVPQIAAAPTAANAITVTAGAIQVAE